MTNKWTAEYRLELIHTIAMKHINGINGQTMQVIAFVAQMPGSFLEQNEANINKETTK